MNRSLLTTAALGLLASGPAAAQQFEGVVTMTVQGGRTGELTQMYKAGKVRTEMKGPEGQSGVMLMEPGKSGMTMIMPSEKMYMVMDPAMMGGRAPRDTTPPKITKLGTSETIAGKSCDNYRVESQQVHEVCAAKGMGFFGGMGGGPMMGGRGPGGGQGGGGMPAFASEKMMAEFKEGFFPLRISRVEGEKKTVAMEVTTIEEKPLPSSLFEVPEGYTKMDMPMGMPGMGRP
jgi:hypothetical protein